MVCVILSILLETFPSSRYRFILGKYGPVRIVCQQDMGTALGIMRIRCGCTATPEKYSFLPDEIRNIVSHSALYRRLSAIAQLGSVRLWPACGEAEKGHFAKQMHLSSSPMTASMEAWQAS